MSWSTLYARVRFSIESCNYNKKDNHDITRVARCTAPIARVGANRGEHMSANQPAAIVWSRNLENPHG